MSRTYTSLHYHIIFGTKNRVPLLDAAWRVRLHEYLGGEFDFDEEYVC